MKIAALCLGLLACAVARADVPPVEIELAKAHYRTGEIYYQAGRYPDAAREFEEAFRLSGRAEFLYNMGRSYDRAGDPAQALFSYRRFIANMPKSRDAPEVEGRIDLLKHQVGRLKVTSTVAGASVRLDGAPVGDAPVEREVTPGTHKVEVAKEGYGTWRQSVTLKADEDVTAAGAPVSLVKVIRVESKAKETPVYKRWWPWTIGAVVLVAAGGVTAGVLGSRASNTTPELHLPSVK